MLPVAVPLPLSPRARIVVDFPSTNPDWILPENQVPESRPHDLVVEHVRALLAAWAVRSARSALVCRNLAVRWNEATPAMGVDPDICVIDPPAPEGDALTSLQLWETGHVPPIVAVEIVSPTRPDKDYTESPAKYAANGTGELWVFDPMLAGRKALDGPHRIQVWRRSEEGDFLRVYAGEGPAWSETVKGWLVVVAGGSALALADDKAGTRRWRTAEEEAQRRAERLAAKLRELGVDPDTID